MGACVINSWVQSFGDGYRPAQGDSDRDTGRQRQGHRETGTQGDRETGTQGDRPAQGDSDRHLAWSGAGTGRQRQGHRETGT